MAMDNQTSAIGIYQLNRTSQSTRWCSHSRSLTLLGDGSGVYNISDSADRSSSYDISYKGRWILEDEILLFTIVESEVNIILIILLAEGLLM